MGDESMKLWFRLVVFVMFIVPPSGFCSDLPEILQDLVATGVKQNLGLQIEKIAVDSQMQETVIADSHFDSVVQGSVGFEQTAVPYESYTGFSDTLDTDQISSQVGLNRQLSYGTQFSLGLSTQWTRDNDVSNDLDDRYRTGLFLELNQPLLKGLGKHTNLTSVNISRNKERQAALNYLLKTQSFILTIEITYWQLAGSVRLVELRQESLTLAEELLRANHKRYEAGVVAVTEIQEAETAQADRQLKLSQALQQRQLLYTTLRRLVNASIPTIPSLVTDAFDKPEAELSFGNIDLMLTDAEGKRLEFKLANLDVDNSTLQRDYQLNQLKPQLDLTFRAGVSGLAGEDRGAVLGSQYKGDLFDSYSSLGSADGHEWQVGLNFSLPLDNRQAKARLLQAKQNLVKTGYAIEDLKLQVMDELSQQQIHVERSWEQLQIAERFSELADTSLKQERRRLDEGLSDTFRIINFQENMIAAKIGRINALISYHLAIAKMAYVRGMIFDRFHLIVTNNTEEIKLEKL